MVPWLDVVTSQSPVVWCSVVPAGRRRVPSSSDLQDALVDKDRCVTDAKVRESFVRAHRHTNDSAVQAALNRSVQLDWVEQQPRKIDGGCPFEHGILPT